MVTVTTYAFEVGIENFGASDAGVSNHGPVEQDPRVLAFPSTRPQDDSNSDLRLDSMNAWYSIGQVSRALGRKGKERTGDLP